MRKPEISLTGSISSIHINSLKNILKIEKEVHIEQKVELTGKLTKKINILKNI